MYLIQMEDKYVAEETQAKAEADLRSRIFAADMPHGWQIYKALYPEEDSPETEMGGPIEEYVPEDERDLQKLVNEMKRSGVQFAE